MWHDILARLRLMVMRGRLPFVDDTGSVQLTQVQMSANWLQDKTPRLAEYGFQSSPPAGADAVVLFIAGMPADAVVVATGHQTYRVRNLATGEVAISDDKGQKIYLSAAGIRIEGSNLPIQINTTGSLTINAATLAVNAATTFTGTVKANGKSIDDTHRHTTTTTGNPTSTPL